MPVKTKARIETKNELPPNGMPEFKTYGELPIGATVVRKDIQYIVEQGTEFTKLVPLNGNFAPVNLRRRDETSKSLIIASVPEAGALPMNGAKNPMKQKDITGETDLHKTPPLEVLHAADEFLKRKVEMNTAKTNTDKAAQSLLRVLERNKMTQVTVTDDMKIKRRLVIRQGEEKLKVEKADD